MSITVNTVNNSNNVNTSFLGSVRQSLRFSLPLLVSYAVEFSSPFLGIAMIAHLGADALAAAGLAAVIYFTVLVFFFGVLNAVGIMVGHNFGAQNLGDIGLIMRQGFWVVLILGAPLVLALWFVPPLLMHLSGQTTVVVELAITYLRAVSLSLLPLTVAVVMEQFLIGIGRTRIVLWISLLQVPLEILLIYAFVFGKFGMPMCGIAGVGYGLTTVFVLAAIVVAIYLHRVKEFATYKLFNGDWKLNRNYFCEVLHIGAPIGFSYAIELALFAVMSFLIGRLGRDVLAAHQVAIQYLDFTESAVIFSLVQATVMRISHAAGAQDREGMKRVLRVDVAISSLLITLVVSGYWLFPKFFIALDVDLNDIQYSEIVRYAANFLGIGGVVLLCDNVRFLLTGALRGLKDTRVPMYITTVVLWLIVLPLAYLFGLVWGFGGSGIWWALVIGIVIITVILYVRFVRLVDRVDLAQGTFI